MYALQRVQRTGPSSPRSTTCVCARIYKGCACSCSGVLVCVCVGGVGGWLCVHGCVLLRGRLLASTSGFVTDCVCACALCDCVPVYVCTRVCVSACLVVSARVCMFHACGRARTWMGSSSGLGRAMGATATVNGTCELFRRSELKGTCARQGVAHGAYMIKEAHSVW